MTEKTEEATDKRRREAPERGDVWQSRELGSALGILAAFTWLVLQGPALFAGCRSMLAAALSISPQHATDVDLLQIIHPIRIPIAVFGVIVLAAAILGPMLLGSRWSPAAAAPKPSRLQPLAGLKRMFGIQSLVELGKAIIKAALFAAVGWSILGKVLNGLATLGAAGPTAAATRLGSDVSGLLGTLLMVLVVIAALDLPWQRSRWLAKLRMTKQEVRDEHRESDGNPEVRAAQRRLAKAAARRALRPAMADATVVTVNPSEFAVALRYDPLRDAAPIIVARGRDLIAATIRELATEHGVPVLRYPQLTRAIFFTGRIGSPIRDDLYAAVAAVLAFVFSLDAEAPRQMPIFEIPLAARFDEHGRSQPKA
ncbi:EscU/YscU/HrcU family type III secretion system export apparatus switch protein [Glacieibacterium sp.]|uniref:EscU/YscU/HrcU family type III secretion system export apparatus switch protein n=1 Tax=Glacieibacterium sp. TaxID=2860237 RepID=UPI003AFF7E91